MKLELGENLTGIIVVIIIAMTIILLNCGVPW